MKIRNILKQSGGSVIKLKSKLQKLGILLLTVSFGIILCYTALNFFDFALNGVFLDWFDKNFMYDFNTGLRSASNQEIYTRSIAWGKVKTFLLTLSILIIEAWIISIFLAAQISAKRAAKKTIAEAGRKIHEYMAKDTDAVECFPEHYEDISTQMLAIKTNMLRNEQTLREEALRKNDLITYLAHDLKTPLTSIIGYLSLLDEIPEMPEKQRTKYTKITLDKAQRLEKLINEFFDITRYNLQQISIEKEMADLSYMLLQMADEFYPVLQAHGNTAELDVDEDITVMADTMKLARVFNNILKNAVAYSSPNTPIKIQAKKKENHVQISFSNQGKTIPKQKLDSIFEKFFRLDDARTTNTGGAGLGLAIAKEIITLHDGTILADSENGITTFTVTLPD